jgi:uncharacterized protein (DUF952 family)
MLLEIESSQGLAVNTLAETHFPTSKVQILKDLSDQERCIEIERPNLIIHLCPREEWLQAHQRGEFQDKSLLQDGFIHCSQIEHILDVANHYYQGIPDLILLWIDPDQVASKIQWENADNTLFPHIYGPINLNAVISVTDLKPDTDGNYRMILLPD